MEYLCFMYEGIVDFLNLGYENCKIPLIGVCKAHKTTEHKYNFFMHDLIKAKDIC